MRHSIQKIFSHRWATDGAQINTRISISSVFICAPSVAKILFYFLVCLLPQIARGQAVTVSAAISMRCATAAADEYQKQYGETVQLNFGASGDLANQIVAAVDLFISAGKEQIEQLQKAKLVDGNPAVLVRNELVLITPADDKSMASWEGIKGEKGVHRRSEIGAGGALCDAGAGLSGADQVVGREADLCGECAASAGLCRTRRSRCGCGVCDRCETGGGRCA